MTTTRTTARTAVLAGALGLTLSLAACGSQAPGAPSPSAPSASAPSASPPSASAPSPSVSGSAPSSAAGVGSSSLAADESVTSAPAAAPSGQLSAPTVPSGTVPTAVPGIPGRPGAGGKTVLTGTVRAGVESGCVVLTDAGGAVLANLIGLDTSTTPLGSRVVVTGEFQQDLMTTCQQGKPFQVTSVAKR